MTNETTQKKKTPVKMIKVVVLRDCHYGKCRDIVEITEDDAKSGVIAGYLDDNKSAVEALSCQSS
jgi:L-asparaginase/Glu-tRNA(Gln) amidotransferase subunit D